MEEKRAEIDRRKRHYEDVRQQLEKERERILKHLLPRGAHLGAVAHIEHDGEHREGQPVGGEDAEEAVAQEALHPGTRAIVEAGANEWPVEQEPGQHEEQRDADVGPSQILAAGAGYLARRQSHVRHQHAEPGGRRARRT